MSRHFELLCVFLLGLGQMCIMTGYDTQSFVQESVLHSVNSREPQRIDQYAGYYGQAVCYSAYLLACLLSPWITSLLGAKWSLFTASLCFSVYQLGFFYLNSYYYYISCAVMGCGFALFYTACGSYMTSHSTRATIDQNSAIQWSVSCFCMLVGSGILSAVFTFHKEAKNVSVENTTEDSSQNSVVQHRNFSNEEIFYMYAAFSIITIAANVIFALIPSREIDGCIEGKKDKKRMTLGQQLGLFYSSFISKEMLYLSVSFIHLGFYTAFWVSVFPTSLVFTHSLAHFVYLPALYSLSVGAGEILMGCILTSLSRRIPNFGLKPTMIIGFVLSLLVLLIIASSVSEWSTTMPTDKKGLFLEPSQMLSCFTALLIGMADSCINTSRTVVCAFAMPHCRTEAFAISKFYQALGGCVLMFLSPYLSIYHYVCLLVCTLSISLTLFVKVTNSVQRRDRQDKSTDEEENSSCSKTSIQAIIISIGNNSKC